MSVNFLHGVESIEVPDGARSIRAIKSALIGLVGTAPGWSVSGAAAPNAITMVASRREAALRFGNDESGYSIPQALNAIFDQGGAEILVVNVFDPEVHQADVPDETVTFSTRGKAQLANTGVLAITALTSADGVTPYSSPADYTWSATGALVRVADGAIPVAATVKVSYTRAAPELVTAADIIGAFDVDTEAYTGLQLFTIAYAKLGAFPKILIAPQWSDQRAVSQALETMANTVRAVALIDAAEGLTCQEAIEARSSETDPPTNFQTSSQRAALCYPRVKVYDAATDGERLEPLSQRMAGLISAVDKSVGYWASPSNHEIKGILGLERLLTARLNDSETDVNRLNEAGIVTVFNSFGTGFRLWGNRTAAWPSYTHPKNFLAVRRTADMIMESVEFSMLDFLDQPITNPLIDAVVESVNSFLRTLIGRGGLIDGKCWFDVALNPTSEIALGHLTFSVDFMPPTPAERISFEYYMDTEMLQKLTGTTNGDA